MKKISLLGLILGFLALSCGINAFAATPAATNLKETVIYQGDKTTSNYPNPTGELLKRKNGELVFLTLQKEWTNQNSKDTYYLYTSSNNGKSWKKSNPIISTSNYNYYNSYNGFDDYNKISLIENKQNQLMIFGKCYPLFTTDNPDSKTSCYITSKDGSTWSKPTAFTMPDYNPSDFRIIQDNKGNYQIFYNIPVETNGEYGDYSNDFKLQVVQTKDFKKWDQVVSIFDYQTYDNEKFQVVKVGNKLYAYYTDHYQPTYSQSYASIYRLKIYQSTDGKKWTELTGPETLTKSLKEAKIADHPYQTLINLNGKLTKVTAYIGLEYTDSSCDYYKNKGIDYIYTETFDGKKWNTPQLVYTQNTVYTNYNYIQLIFNKTTSKEISGIAYVRERKSPKNKIEYISLNTTKKVKLLENKINKQCVDQETKKKKDLEDDYKKLIQTLSNMPEEAITPTFAHTFLSNKVFQQYTMYSTLSDEELATSLKYLKETTGLVAILKDTPETSINATFAQNIQNNFPLLGEALKQYGADNSIEVLKQMKKTYKDYGPLDPQLYY